MRKLLCCMSVLALASALSACGGREEPANNVVTEKPTGEPTAPAAPQPATNEKAPAAEPAATKPEPAKPKPAEPAGSAEPVEKASTPACTPEHRAAGHC